MGLTPALVVPGTVAAPTGGNVWDRQVRDALGGTAVAWSEVPGRWPAAGPDGARALGAALAAHPDASPVLVDGIVACGAPDIVLAHTGRLRLGVVVHLPLSLETGLDAVTAAARDADERRVLAAVDVVVVTSRWTAAWLRGRTLRRPPVVAVPGTAPAPAHPAATGDGTHLLCLGAVCARKGQRTLLRALDGVAGGWSLRVVGPRPDPVEADAVAREAAGTDGRVQLLPAATGDALEAHWAWADLLVVPSVVETFGMVVTEALARGRPVLATTGGALPEALGTTADGPPGLLVPPGDAGALGEAMRRWLTDPALRATLRARARARAGTLTGWDDTARAVRGAFA